MRKTRRPRLRPGAYVEVTRDINAIPAGVYRLDQVINGAFCFVVGDGPTPFFIVNKQGRPYLKPLRKAEGKHRLTTLDDFLDRYYGLLEKTRSSQPVFNPDTPFTLCAVSPEEARELH